jgi:hypothetical protein
MAAADDDKHYVCKSEQEALDSIAAFEERNNCSALSVELTICNPSKPINMCVLWFTTAVPPPATTVPTPASG